jgi:hypothetical protein
VTTKYASIAAKPKLNPLIFSGAIAQDLKIPLRTIELLSSACCPTNASASARSAAAQDGDVDRAAQVHQQNR